MTYADTLLLLLTVGFIAWIAYEIHRAPVEHDDMTKEDDEAAEQCIQASRPAPLERPHIKAGTAYGKEVL